MLGEYALQATSNNGHRYHCICSNRTSGVSLICIATIFVSAFGLVGMSAAASMVIMFLLGLPLLILFYTSTADKALKAAFFGLMANIAFLSVAGIIWFIVSDILKIEWLVTAGKVLMTVGYVPLVYALYTVYRDEREKLGRGVRTFIVSANACFAAVIVLIMLTGMQSGDLPDIAIYGITTLEDIAAPHWPACLSWQGLPCGHGISFPSYSCSYSGASSETCLTLSMPSGWGLRTSPAIPCISMIS